MNEGLRAQSISVYLSAVCHLQVSSGLPAPSRSTWPWLQYVIRGIKRTQGPSVRVRLPITASILTQLLEVWSTQLSSGDGYAAPLLWATSCLAFFGFFRLAELLPDSPSSPAPLLLSDIAVDSRSSPSMICLHIRRAKNDPFGKGAKVYLGKTNMALCPVTATLNYIVVRPDAPGPLLLWKTSLPLLRNTFIQAVKAALLSAGINHSLYSGHSFRIGAATSAASAGVPAHLIQTMGRWSSDAYLSYIRTPPESLANISSSLASANVSCTI